MSTNNGIKIVTKQLVRQGIFTTINSQDFLVYERNSSGVTDCSGAAVPTDAGSGFAIGCAFALTTGNGVGTTNYSNEGSATSCDFNSTTLPETGDISSVVAGSGLSGGATSGAATLDVGAGRGIVVRTDAVDVGVNVYNTLGALGIGKLVNLSGFDTTLGVTMTLADADAGVQATHVTIDAIAGTTAGVVYPLGTAVGDVTDNLDTNGRTVGDLVYLSDTAGGFAFTAPSGADKLVQVVGVVKVVSATVGEIVFFPGAQRITKIPTSMLNDQAVNGNKLDSGMFLTYGGLIKDGSNLREGISIYNNTGGTLNAGELVNLSGFTGTDGIVVTKADADAGIRATHVVPQAINNAASGNVVPLGTVQQLNTNGRTIGDLVYVDATTAGAFAFAAPTGADQMVQVVGVVKIVDAVTGEIVFFPGQAQITKIPTSMLQANAVTTAKLEQSDAAGKILVGQGAGFDTTYASIGLEGTIDGAALFRATDTTGASALRIKKQFLVNYDFAVDGGAQGTVAITGAQEIPDNAVVWVESYDVLTTFTSGGADAATVALQLPTDGPLTTAIAISDGTNPFDAGVYSRIAGALATPLTVKTTAARTPSLLVAGGNDLTAGKIVFQLAYWISE